MNWREKYKDKIVTADEAVKCVNSGDSVLIGQTNGVSVLLIEAACRRANELRDIKFYSSLGWKGEAYLDEKYRGSFIHMSEFAYPGAREAYRTGMTQFTPLYFHEFPRFFREVVKPEVSFVMVSEPDENGICSFSMNADFIYVGTEVSKNVILHVNPAMPYTRGVSISLDKATYIVEGREEPLIVAQGNPGPIEEQIARHIVPHIEDGATLQMGIGTIPDFVLSLLGDKKNLGVHTELFADGVIDLYNKGVINNTKKNIDVGKIVTTFIFGSKKLSEFVHLNDDVLLMPVDYTNDPYIIAKNDKVVSINSCLEVDMLGQVNSDTLNGYPYSGVGGQVDFVRGARMSKGGQSFLTMPSTAAKGRISRIVCKLGTGSPVTTSRFDVDNIVTEYGIAKMWGRTLRQRAQSLISIAHPDFREQLEREAHNAGLLK
ncbi:MAG: acetyl-CoA hydrolase/transferase C-terminal domain-containing protein [Smithellaceae bacterium]|nr:acetyl-CoA hydrolase/transferase C-terminal domain-containing protein [Smithellaceae bacterium]